MDTYDVIVIGGGPGGYVAAIRAAQLGFKTACIERWQDAAGKPVLGGTCLNVGCIPSKALLDSSHHFEFMQRHAADHGITVEPRIDIARMQARKTKVVQTLTQGIAGLLKKNKIAWLQGSASFRAPTEIVVRAAGKDDQAVTAEHIIIATGSVPATIPPAPIDGERIVDSTGALAFDDVPARLGVIGAGVIGLELGRSAPSRQPTVLEALLPRRDRSRHRQRPTSCPGLTSVRRPGNGREYRPAGSHRRGRTRRQAGAFQVRQADQPSAASRTPPTSRFDAAGVKTDARVSSKWTRTAIAGIHAIGDCVRTDAGAQRARDRGRRAACRPYLTSISGSFRGHLHLARNRLVATPRRR